MYLSRFCNISTSCSSGYTNTNPSQLLLLMPTSGFKRSPRSAARISATSSLDQNDSEYFMYGDGREPQPFNGTWFGNKWGNIPKNFCAMHPSRQCPAVPHANVVRCDPGGVSNPIWSTSAWHLGYCVCLSMSVFLSRAHVSITSWIRLC